MTRGVGKFTGGVVAAGTTERISPIHVAISTLGKRLQEKDVQGQTVFVLDGTPAKLGQIMLETNRLRHEAGLEQMTANPEWAYAPGR